MIDQLIVFAILAASLVLFVHGAIRYDLVALLALLGVVVTGVAPAQTAFDGFGHPAVVTVAAVLVISRGLSAAGVVDVIVRWLSRLGDSFAVQLTALTAVVMVASGFMNNVGALALMMPVAVRMARTSNRPPSLMLMPLAFGSLLGGLTTLIGTPPNIIISAIRKDALGSAYAMFDFAPVGIGVAIAGLAFLCLIGWRLIPCRKDEGRDDLFHIDSYMTEVRVTEDSPLIGKLITALEDIPALDVVVVGLERGDHMLGVPANHEIIQSDDVLVVEASPKDLELLLESSGLELRGSKSICSRVFDEDTVSGPVPVAPDAPCEKLHSSSHMDLVETVVGINSRMVNRTVLELNLRNRYGINLLAVSRQGRPMRQGLKLVRFLPGDALLLQGTAAAINQTLPQLGCFPLAERELRLVRSPRALSATLLFALGVGLATFGILPVQIALTLSAVLMILTGTLTLREAYEGIEWPVLILLGAMFPLGDALEASGGAASIAGAISAVSQSGGPVLALGLMLAATMLLSNIINNAAAAVLMAPIALRVATGFAVNADPFLMAVCIGCSTPFLTPIGHQSNTLVMGPGGYRFGDYWPMGLPLSFIVLAAALPLILLVWPL